MRTLGIIICILAVFACTKQEEAPQKRASDLFIVDIYDANGDGITDIDDFLTLNSEIFDCTGDCDADFDEDGDVDINDFILLNSNFATTDSAMVNMGFIDLHTFAIGAQFSNTSNLSVIVSGFKPNGEFYIMPVGAANKVTFKVNTLRDYGEMYINGDVAYTFPPRPCTFIQHKNDYLGNMDRFGKMSMRGRFSWPDCAPHPVNGIEGFDYDPWTVGDSVASSAIIDVIVELEFNRAGFPDTMVDTCFSTIIRQEGACTFNSVGQPHWTQARFDTVPVGNVTTLQTIHTNNDEYLIPAL